MNARSLMRIHVEALFTQDTTGRLVAVNEFNGGPAPRFFLGRTSAGSDLWFRHDIDHPTAKELISLSQSDACSNLEDERGPDQVTRFTQCLSRVEPVVKVWAGPAFIVPDVAGEVGNALRVTPTNADVLSPYLEAWREDIVRSALVFVVLEGDAAVSVCASVRISPRAHEAGVETHPTFRGRGYAALAVTAWAAAVRESGCIPLYSTSWRNTASRQLARKLGLLAFGTDLHIT